MYIAKKDPQIKIFDLCQKYHSLAFKIIDVCRFTKQSLVKNFCALMDIVFLWECYICFWYGENEGASLTFHPM